MAAFADEGPGDVHAPVASDQAPAVSSQTPVSGGMNEIVVTANKRSENINKVGMSITAISGDELKERQVTSLQDVAALVPGLQFAASTSNTPIFTLRGVGFNENSLGVYPAVSVYLDQAPLPFPVLASHTAFDLDRVEALKGPQGTLFGQNSTGGAINYIAARPTDTLQSGWDLTYGRFNQVSGNGYISGPITDTLKARLAVAGQREDGWQQSMTRPGDTNGAQAWWAARLLLDWKPTDRLHIAFDANGWVDQSQPLAQQLIAKGAALPGYVYPSFVNAPFAANNARSADWATVVRDPFTGQAVDFTPYSNRRFFQLTGRIDYDVTDDITLTSLTTYDHFDQNQATNGDGMGVDNYDLPGDDGRITSFSQEIRLANAATNRFRWVVGGSLEHSRTSESQDDRYYENSNDSAPNLYINTSLDLNQQNIYNYAAFANGEFNLTDQLTLLGGVRYTDSKIKDYNCGTTTPTGHVNDLFNVLGGLLGTVPFTPASPDQCYTLNYNNVPGEAFAETLHQHNVSWRAGVNYQLTPATLFYGNVSRGYKAGSFPSLAASSFISLEPVTQESVTAYEIGFKTQQFNRKLMLTGAAFYYDYNNKQIRGKYPDQVFGLLDKLVNVPKSRIWGLESSVTLRPVTGLMLRGDITYLNSRVLNFVGVDSIGNQNVNFQGDVLPFTPKWSGNFNIDYRYQLANGAPFVGLTLAARTSEDATLGGGHTAWPTGKAQYSIAPGIIYPYYINGYATVDARLGYESKAGWKAFVWGRNIFNKYYFNTVIAGSETVSRIAALPAPDGVTLSVNFK